MVCFAVFHSADPRGLGVRLEHTHCFSDERGEGGHYYYVLDGEGVEYEDHFNPARTYYLGHLSQDYSELRCVTARSA